MVIENVSEIEVLILENLPQVIRENFSGLIIFIQAVGIVFIVYVIYLIVNGVLRWKDRRRLKRIESKIDRLERKVDTLIRKKKKKKKK